MKKNARPTIKTKNVTGVDCIQNLIANAGFRYLASVLDVNYTANRSLDKKTFERLALLDFIKRGENLILTGGYLLLWQKLKNSKKFGL